MRRSQNICCNLNLRNGKLFAMITCTFDPLNDTNRIRIKKKLYLYIALVLILLLNVGNFSTSDVCVCGVGWYIQCSRLVFSICLQ